MDWKIVILSTIAFTVVLKTASAQPDLSMIRVCTANETQQWLAWKEKYGKTYANASEEARRQRIFCLNARKIEKHNRENTSYKLELNQFADLAENELPPQATGLIKNKASDDMPKFNASQFKVGKKVKAGAVVNLGPETGPVKDQGRCGSCVSFQVASLAQYHSYKESGVSSIFSEQSLLDCSKDSNFGCDGTLPGFMVDHVVKNGIAEQAKYPYKMKQGSCKISARVPYVYKFPATHEACAGNLRGKEDVLQAVFDAWGPVPITIGTNSNLIMYKGGIFNDASCPKKATHAVLLVGYGVDAATNKPYWIIKNSWNQWWGEKGFGRLAMGSTICGIGFEVYPLCPINR